MDKEFVPYEQALALKELGFDEPCLGWYSTKGVFYADIHANSTTELNTTTRRGSFANAVLAPLYQQAFRWFREKYRYYYEIGYAERIDFYYTIYSQSQNYAEHNDFGNFEEAELACLKKLIEIVKEKQ